MIPFALFGSLLADIIGGHKPTLQDIAGVALTQVSGFTPPAFNLDSGLPGAFHSDLAQFGSLVDDHAGALQQENAALRAELELLRSAHPQPPAVPQAITQAYSNALTSRLQTEQRMDALRAKVRAMFPDAAR